MKNHICQLFIMWIITYMNKGLNLFSFFLKIFKYFKLNYYVQQRNGKITNFVGINQFSGGFWGSQRSIMFQTGFIRVCRLGVQKVIFGDFDKKQNFLSTFFLRILCWFRNLNKISKNMKVYYYYYLFQIYT